MTNRELYNIAKECIFTGDTKIFSSILPNHYLAKDENFVLPEGKSKYGFMFNSVNDVAELDVWASGNYKLSGKYSDELTMVLLPKSPNVCLEIKNRFIYKALWVVTPGMLVDITHNIHFVGEVPICRMPSDSGYVFGSIVSKLSDQELYKLMISPFPDEQILDCNFVVSCAHFIPTVFDKIDDMFETLNKIGFKTAVLLNTTIPKWGRVIESAKLVAGSGNLEYECTKVLTSYSDIEMVDLLSTTTINKWGVTTDITPTTLFEVVGLFWDTVVDNGRSNVIPVVAFKYGNYPLDNITTGQIEIGTKSRVFYKKIFGFNVQDIGKYCVGDMFSCTIKDGIIILNRAYGSNKIPILSPACPKCGHGLDVSVNKLFCVNIRCPSVVMSSILVWVDKFCVGVGDDVLLDFMRRYEITNIGDIYEVADANIMSIVEYLPIFNGIENSRAQPSEFLNILMPFLGEKECAAIMVTLHFDSAETDRTISHLFTDTTLSKMGIDNTSINKILNFIDSSRTLFANIMKRYLRCSDKHELYRRVFAVVGLLYDKDLVKYEMIINKYGGRVVSKVVPYITGCIYGKYVEQSALNIIRELAKHKDIAIYSEEEFTERFVRP